MKIISIHQPGYLPWLGFFKKIMYSDVFVFLDNVKFVPRQWHNRNKIRTSQESTYLTVPIKKASGKNINDILIDYSENWSMNHKKTIFYNYSKAKFFTNHFSFFENLYGKKFDKLLDLNMEIIYYLMKKFDINTQIIFASELDISSTKSDLNLDICKKLDADVYLSGITGKNYLKEEDFDKSNIKIEYQNFQHPNYSQVYQPFISNMAAIDLLFNEGNNSAKVLRKASNF